MSQCYQEAATGATPRWLTTRWPRESPTRAEHTGSPGRARAAMWRVATMRASIICLLQRLDVSAVIGGPRLACGPSGGTSLVAEARRVSDTPAFVLSHPSSAMRWIWFVVQVPFMNSSSVRPCAHKSIDGRSGSQRLDYQQAIVGYQGQTGKHVLGVRFSQCDPTETLAGEICCDAQCSFPYDAMVGCDPRLRERT
jgi:hypothetical protein